MTDFEKTQLNMRVSLDINDQLTWAELYRFVEIAKREGRDPEQQVPMEHDESGYGVTAFFLYMDDEHSEKLTP
ncbi:hypothetical protein AB0O34_20140 [Sphaerisporangium sp. NPDC088356]|uniref:hypothetical protein n=1 Tax=Sphaerisporangium sp. NPDC088356 TaxID=3154871 RepID=UPI00344473E9